MSVLNDLKVDVERDFSDIGVGRIEVYVFNKVFYLYLKKKSYC